jgi:hypothetical protein
LDHLSEHINRFLNSMKGYSLVWFIVLSSTSQVWSERSLTVAR